MPTFDAVIVGKITLPEVSTGPLPPGTEPPLGIWGPTDPRPTPPIYIPVPPPTEEGGAKPEHPIYIPVWPAHPIVIPVPPDLGAHPEHPIAYPPLVWPPLPTHPIAPGGPPPHPAHPIHLPPGIWGGGNVPMPSPPIYIPVPQPPDAAYPEHPIYWPVYPDHPIVLPPEGEKPELPPAFVSPPSGARGYWGYSPYYDSMVFVPFEGALDAPHVEPRRGPAAGPAGTTRT
jgi:hypothetical protein